MPRSRTIPEWENEFKKQRQEYQRLQKSLQEHARFLAAAVKDLVQYPKGPWRSLAEQKSDKKVTYRKNRLGQPLLDELMKQIAQVKVDIEEVSQRLVRAQRS